MDHIQKITKIATKSCTVLHKKVAFSLKMSNRTFRCKKCGKFAEPSSRAGSCKPCAADYYREYRAKNKLEKNTNVEENIASSSNGGRNLQVPENSGGPRIPPEFSGGHMNFGNSQYPINYPMNPYLNMIPSQNSQTDNGMIMKLMARLDVLEKKNEELEKEVLFLKQNSGIDPNVKLDPHPYGEEYEPKLHPRQLEMRICYNDIQLNDLVKSTIKGLIFKSLDEIQESIEDYGDRLDKLEKETKCLDNIGLEIEKLKKELGDNLGELNIYLSRTDNSVRSSEYDIKNLEAWAEKSKKIINWLTLAEDGNKREIIILDLFDCVTDLVNFCNSHLNANIKGIILPNRYRNVNELEKRRKEAEFILRK